MDVDQSAMDKIVSDNHDLVKQLVSDICIMSLTKKQMVEKIKSVKKFTTKQIEMSLTKKQMVEKIKSVKKFTTKQIEWIDELTVSEWRNIGDDRDCTFANKVLNYIEKQKSNP